MDIYLYRVGSPNSNSFQPAIVVSLFSNYRKNEKREPVSCESHTDVIKCAYTDETDQPARTKMTTNMAGTLPFEYTPDFARRREQVRERMSRVQTHQIVAEAFLEGETWKSLPDRLQSLMNSTDKQALTTAILCSATERLYRQLESLCRASLAYRIRNTVDEDEDEEPDLEEEFLTSTVMFDQMRELGWMETLLYDPLHKAVEHTVAVIVRETAAEDWETPDLFTHVKLQSQAVRYWLQDVCPELSFDLHEMAARLFCELRMKEIFEIVTDFPDSQPACEELRDLLQECNLLPELCSVLRDTLVRRVNHPGAETSAIIDVYIHTIKVLYVLDAHRDRWLAAVTHPVRTYLRNRSDTVRCILTSLTTGDLHEELLRPDAKLLEHVVVDSDDEEEQPTMDWIPPPSIANRHMFLESYQGESNSSSDILAMLVSIYGSKQLFVQEYRLMLADKLLSAQDYNTDEQVKTLELLKLRFGETSMRSPEVMIKDMDDSKRTNALLQSDCGNQSVDAVMVSHVFWPPLQKEPMQHHQRIQRQLEEFGHSYGKLKNPRQLVWMNQLGSVDLDLQVLGEDGTLQERSFKCSTLQATLILHFEDRMEWTLSHLSSETGIPEHVLQKRISFWTTNGVLYVSSSSPSNTAYRLVSQLQAVDETSQHEDEQEGPSAVSMAAQEQEEMEIYESYIIGMLTNLGQLPLQKIHNMLQTFVTGSEHRYDKTAAQLSSFLQKMAKEEKIECGPDGMYKLFKK